jgi:2-oxoglutarate ferredoxin oxidoreductase subunit delta
MPETKNKKFSVKLEIIEEWCKGCGVCVAFCPQDVLEIRGIKVAVKDMPKCTGCGICELICPDFAIKVFKERLAGVPAEDGQ